eukprot:4238046-Pleurochrysis_carterae.AAC.5
MCGCWCGGARARRRRQQEHACAREGRNPHGPIRAGEFNAGRDTLTKGAVQRRRGVKVRASSCGTGYD